MTMVIVRNGDLFGAVMTAPHSNARYWTTDGLLTRDNLIREVLAAGAHQIDLGDLLAELDSDPKKFCTFM